MKTFRYTVMEISRALPYLWPCAWELFACAHNQTSQPALKSDSYRELGQIYDISALPEVFCYEKVFYYKKDASPQSKEEDWLLVGPC